MTTGRSRAPFQSRKFGKPSILYEGETTKPVRAQNNIRGWELTTLGSIVRPRREKVHPSTAPTARYIGLEHVQAHSTRLLETAPAYGMRSSANRFYGGDVLYGRLRPYLNKVHKVDFSGLCSAEFIVFPKTDGVDPDFLQYRLNAADFAHFASHLNAGDRPRVDFDQLAGFEIFLPPLDEQQHIVAEIEKQFTRLDAGVGSLKHVRSALKRYRASVLKAACEGRLVTTEAELAQKENRRYEAGDQLLQRIVEDRRQTWNGKSKYREPRVPDLSQLPPLSEGWTWCMSDALFVFVTSGSRGWAKHYSESGPIFLRIGNLHHEDIRLDLTDLQHVTPPRGTEGTRTAVKANDILISITADVGMVALVPTRFSESYINQHVALTRPTSLVCAEYIAYYLCGSEGGWRHLKKLERGATKVGLGLDDIRSVPIPLPPLAEQTRIVAEVERRLSIIDRLEEVVSVNFERGIRLRQSILQRAFQGGTI